MSYVDYGLSIEVNVNRVRVNSPDINYKIYPSVKRNVAYF